jgi:serine/threonine protein kinase
MKTVDNFYLTKIIGAGAYGSVYICKIKKEELIEPDTRDRMRPGRRVACKMIKQKNIKAKIKKYLIQEIEVMMSIKHDNILRFLEAKKTSNNIYIFFEFCNGGDLRRLLDLKGGKLDESLTQIIVKQLVEGLNHLNDNKSMHRDLKLDNILINFPDYNGEATVPDEYIQDFDPTEERIEVIIGDLGFARNLGQQDMATSYCGTPLNMAPEIINGRHYDTKVDIWSLGTMIYELLVGFAPFTGVDPYDLANNVNAGNYGVPKNIKLSLKCLDLLHKCLQFEPKKRAGHKELLLHPFLEVDEIDSEKIDLSVSRGPGQNSFFDAPTSGFEIDEKNAVMFNVKDSCLFNNHYNQSLKKFQEKQNNGEQIELPEPEIPSDVSENNIVDAVDCDEFELMEEEKGGIIMNSYKSIEPLKSYKQIEEENEEYKEESKEEYNEEAIKEVVKEIIEEIKNDAIENSQPKISIEDKPEQVSEPLLDPVPIKEETVEIDQKVVEPVIQISEQNNVNELENQPIIENSEKPQESDNKENENDLLSKLEIEEKVDNDIEESDSEEDEPGNDFTIIDMKGLKPIQEDPAELDDSTFDRPGLIKLSTVPENDDEEGQNMDDSFEIVHYHDILMVDKSYLIEDSKAG